jgi:uncharacterized protein YndB with AHSA1/START domain
MPAAATPATTDRIEKRIEINAPRGKVWRAISSAEEFGAWFGMSITEPFAPGATNRGMITPKGNEHLVEFHIEKMEAERYFSYRWHPYGIDPEADLADEPLTLVEFIIDEAANGSIVTIIESGFDAIPAGRRDLAFRMNDGGWNSQLQKLVKHVS